LHAGNNLPFQEYILIPKSNSPFESTNIIVSAYSNLREDLKRVYGPQATNVGDEGGFAPMLSDPISPYTLIENAVSNLGYKDIVEYGMDAAANNSGKSVSELFNIYEKMLNSHNIVYLEDPFSEKDEDSFQRITALFRHKVMISGDDITVTDKKRISRLSQKGAISAVIIKPNQIGTISEAIEAVKEARKNNISVVVSHRSGETNDDFIADFAVGVGADGIKLGAPARGERVSKYNRLLEIEREFAGGL
jgi:enolase